MAGRRSSEEFHAPKGTVDGLIVGVLIVQTECKRTGRHQPGRHVTATRVDSAKRHVSRTGGHEPGPDDRGRGGLIILWPQVRSLPAPPPAATVSGCSGLHVLRHSAAARMIQAGGSPKALSRSWGTVQCGTEDTALVADLLNASEQPRSGREQRSTGSTTSTAVLGRARNAERRHGRSAHQWFRMPVQRDGQARTIWTSPGCRSASRDTDVWKIAVELHAHRMEGQVHQSSKACASLCRVGRPVAVEPVRNAHR
jgi:hypothetical protein